MARVYTYSMIAVGILVLFSIARFDVGFNAIESLFNVATGQITISTFFDSLFNSASGIITAVAVGGAIIAGLFTRAQPENFILVPLITGILANLVGVFISLITYAQSGAVDAWVGYIIVAILSPFAFGYILSLAEFFRGTA